jgi:hypothetical protein
MSYRRLSGIMLCFAAVLFLTLGSGGLAAGASPPATTPQRAVAEQWVAYTGAGDQRGACELEAVQNPSIPCSILQSSVSVECPLIRAGAKPPYRKSEVRTAAEQVGRFTAESLTRGFVKVYAEVKAKKLWGTLGLEQTAPGSWGVTYLRFGGETIVPAWTTYRSLAWPRLWVSNWCPTDHPRYEHKKN